MSIKEQVLKELGLVQPKVHKAIDLTIHKTKEQILNEIERYKLEIGDIKYPFGKGDIFIENNNWKELKKELSLKKKPRKEK